MGRVRTCCFSGLFIYLNSERHLVESQHHSKNPSHSQVSHEQGQKSTWSRQCHWVALSSSTATTLLNPKHSGIHDPEGENLLLDLSHALRVSLSWSVGTFPRNPTARSSRTRMSWVLSGIRELLLSHLPLKCETSPAVCGFILVTAVSMFMISGH